MYALTDYDYDLPGACISQKPVDKRDHSRLLSLNRRSGAVAHGWFYDIEDVLKSGDLLVINNTRVIPGRLFGKKETGGQVEVLILDYASGLRQFQKTGEFGSTCLIKASKRPKTGTLLIFDNQILIAD